MNTLAASDHRRGHVEVSGVEPGGLHGGVNGVDVVFVEATRASVSPRWWCSIHGVGIAFEVVVECAGDDPVVRFVGVEGARIAGSQQQRRGSLPGMDEAVQPFELVDPAVGAQFGEQAATADGLQLAMVADQHEPPLVRLGETTS